MKRTILLNESGSECGDRGTLKDVFSLGSFDSEADYFIEVETVTPAEGDDGSRGLLRLPVRSVGKIGRSFFFSTDLRFADFLGAERVFPEEAPSLVLQLINRPGGIDGTLTIQGEEDHLVRTGIMKDSGAATERLSKWAQARRDRFRYPRGLLEYADDANDLSPTLSGGVGLKGERPSLSEVEGTSLF